MLAGRNPHTDERLITAQGSAGRRPTLGAGSHTRVAADGEQLFDVADAAVVLGFVNDWYDPHKAAARAALDGSLGVDERQRLEKVGQDLAMRDLPGQPHVGRHRAPAA